MKEEQWHSIAPPSTRKENVMPQTNTFTAETPDPIPPRIHAANLVYDLEHTIAPRAAKRIVARHGHEPNSFSVIGAGGKAVLNFLLPGKEWQIKYAIHPRANVAGVTVRSKISLYGDGGRAVYKSHNLTQRLKKASAEITAEDLIQDFDFLWNKIMESLPPDLQRTLNWDKGGSTTPP